MAARLSASDVSMLFDGRRLTLARQLAAIHQNKLATKVGCSPAAVSTWEAGTKKPTAQMVAALAMALSVKPGFFVERISSVDALKRTPHFRTLRSTSKKSRDQASAYGCIVVDLIETFNSYVDFPSVELPTFSVDSSDSQSSGPEAAARAVRLAYGLGSKPVGHLVRLLENHGIFAVFSPEQSSDVDAFSFRAGLGPLIVMNPHKRDYYRQRFDVAHELGHLVMHSHAPAGDRTVESQAHQFAAEFLMPADQIEASLPSTITSSSWGPLMALKEYWGVSMQALLYRAKYLGKLDDENYQRAMMTLSKRGWRRREPGRKHRVETPSLFPAALELIRSLGISDEKLMAESDVPTHLFAVATARHPDDVPLYGIPVRDAETNNLHILDFDN